MRVRSIRYKSGRIKWQLDLGMVLTDGGKKKRDQRYFDTKEEAEGAKKIAKAQRKKHGDDSVSLPEASRIRYQAAEKRLARIGWTIEAAVELAERQATALTGPIELAAGLELCVAQKQQLAIDDRSVVQFKSSCKSFILLHAGKMAHEITKRDIQAWILSNGWSPKTQRNYLGDLRTYFAWLIENGHVAENPCITSKKRKDRIKVAEPVETEISAYGPEVCRRLLFGALTLTELRFNRETGDWEHRHVYRCLIGYIALAMFGGIRPNEVEESDRSEIELELKTAVVKGTIAKTKKRRVVELHDAAVEWLRVWEALCPRETKIIPSNFRRLWEGLRKRLALFPWPHDILRHTFASMHFAFYKDRARLQAELGHSEDEDTLERHYKSIKTLDGRTISPAMANRFWQLFPPPRYFVPPEEILALPMT